MKDKTPFPPYERDRQTVIFMTNSNDKSGELLGQELRRRWSPEQKLGSSRITGKDALDLHEKEFAIPVTVRHPLDDLYSVVYSVCIGQRTRLTIPRQ